MKYVLSILCLFMLGACTEINTSNNTVAGADATSGITCGDLDDINWSDKETTVAMLESCYESFQDSSISTSDVVDKKYIDPMLYLSYIYLSDGPHQNIERANIILQDAMTEMSKDCEEAHGTYSNFCYMVYFKDEEKIPTHFATLKDAMHIYHMSMPCVYPEMLTENPDAIELMGSYFGSSRDAIIPGLCNSFPYKIIDMIKFRDLKNYDKLAEKYSDGPIEGTIRFAIHQDQYKDMVEMLFWPDKKLADNNPDDPYILVYSIGENPDPIKTRLKPFESDIRQYPDLNGAYDKMIENTTRHYIDFLHLAPDVAARYAPIIVLSSLYNFVLY